MGDVRSTWLGELEKQLEEKRAEKLFRELRPVSSAVGPEIVIGGKSYVQFCSNNYLGLAGDPEVIDAAREAAGKYGAGAGASRLVAGTFSLHEELEEALARFKGTERALLFPTGFMANLAALTTFAGAGDLIVSDKLNHASLLDGAEFSGALHRTFPHKKYERARELLAKETPSAGGRRFVVSDTVFSMDGDVADLGALCDAADASGALVVIDEAHATGVVGARGAGLAELQGVEERIAITVGTLSKALGSMGGFIAGPRAVIETLINAARSFVYTTALSPAACGAALAALRIVEREPERRKRVLALAARVREELVQRGLNCGDSASAIVPVVLGDAGAAMTAAQKLMEKGLYVPAIRPPTVAPGAARLRISLMSSHTDAQVDRLIDTCGRLVAGF